MVIKQDRVFNLIDTNGRRGGILNALQIYLEILEDLRWSHPDEPWAKYPESIAQTLFYEAAIARCADVFQKHPRYDRFLQDLGADRPAFLARDPRWLREEFPKYRSVLDVAVEKRARHYTSTLVKIGFATPRRRLTPAGQAFLRGKVERDALESLLPLDDVNLLLLRQLAKLRVFSTPENGLRRFYSPFFMALALLLDGGADLRAFQTIVQGLSPYASPDLQGAIRRGSLSPDELEKAAGAVDLTLPEPLRGQTTLSPELFRQYFKSSKQNDRVAQDYHRFFQLLSLLRQPSAAEEAFADLARLFARSGSVLNRAFGCGRAVFVLNRCDSLSQFLERNPDHPLLTAPDLTAAFYEAYTRSKHLDRLREYSDTTIRLLRATGLFRFNSLPQLAYREALERIFPLSCVRENIFGQVSEEEYLRAEAEEDSLLGQNLPLSRILGHSVEEVAAIASDVQTLLGASAPDAAQRSLQDRRSAEFLAHVREKYPKERVSELLALVSDRRNDTKLRSAVNDAASVPTIYEYLVAIAWFYLSHEEYDLLASLNLTLDADFEPVYHAPGGGGDIVIHYPDLTVMLEVTLMNKQAQRRGEWEPVLRHSLNLKAACAPQETVTFFIADELDHNTINIWRAVAAATLESTDTHTLVRGSIIMPFTNRDLIRFLASGVSYRDILSATRASFARVPAIADTAWHSDILRQLLP